MRQLDGNILKKNSPVTKPATLRLVVMLKKLAINLLMTLFLKLMSIQESSDTHEECFNMKKNTMKTIKNSGRNSVNFENNKR